MILQSNAKINLGLSVIHRRADGFHNLESIFIPIPWSDEIELLPAEEFSFQSTGIPIPGSASENLCCQAYELLKAEFNLPPVSIRLHKQVPIGAGLGGGSSNASAVLQGLNRLFDLGLDEGELMERAKQLGSDCPFFIRNEAAFVSGTGDVFTYDFGLNLKAHVLVINPGIHISTQEAYGSIEPQAASFDLRQINALPKAEWKENIKNDFEAPARIKYPDLKKLQEQLYAMGAYYVSMSGSGSSYFAFFEKGIPEMEWGKNWSLCQFELSIP